jgi:hypothetical protein
MDGILLAVVLGLLSLAFVLQPLYTGARATKRGKLSLPHSENDSIASPVSPRAEQDASAEVGETRETRETRETGQAEQEQAARAALHEVELDYQLGNITEADYRALRERYTRRALRALKVRYDREQELDDLIEQQLQRLKEQDERIT